MSDEVAWSLAKDLVDVDPQRLAQWAQSKGWTPHPTAQPKTLRAWASPDADRLGQGQTVSLPISLEDAWYSQMAAQMIGTISQHNSVGLIVSLRELGLV